MTYLTSAVGHKYLRNIIHDKSEVNTNFLDLLFALFKNQRNCTT